MNHTSILDDYDEGCSEATALQLQHAQPARDLRAGPPQRRHPDVHARPRRCAGPVRHGIGHG